MPRPDPPPPDASSPGERLFFFVQLCCMGAWLARTLTHAAAAGRRSGALQG